MMNNIRISGMSRIGVIVLIIGAVVTIAVESSDAWQVVIPVESAVCLDTTESCGAEAFCATHGAIIYECTAFDLPQQTCDILGHEPYCCDRGLSFGANGCGNQQMFQCVYLGDDENGEPQWYRAPLGILSTECGRETCYNSDEQCESSGI